MNINFFMYLCIIVFIVCTSINKKYNNKKSFFIFPTEKSVGNFPTDFSVRNSVIKDTNVIIFPRKNPWEIFPRIISWENCIKNNYYVVFPTKKTVGNFPTDFFPWEIPSFFQRTYIPWEKFPTGLIRTEICPSEIPWET